MQINPLSFCDPGSNNVSFPSPFMALILYAEEELQNHSDEPEPQNMDLDNKISREFKHRVQTHSSFANPAKFKSQRFKKKSLAYSLTPRKAREKSRGPFPCPICMNHGIKKQYAYSYGLRRHMNNIHSKNKGNRLC